MISYVGILYTLANSKYCGFFFVRTRKKNKHEKNDIIENK